MEVWDVYRYRVQRLGQVRVGAQRLMLSLNGVVGADGFPSARVGWDDELRHVLTGEPAAGARAMAEVEETWRGFERECEEARRAALEAAGEAGWFCWRRCLSPEDEALLWAVAAPELDPGVGRLFEMMGGVDEDGVRLGFALRVAAGPDFEAVDRLRARVVSGAPLVRLRFLVSRAGLQGRALPLLGRGVRAAASVVERLGGDGGEAGRVPSELGGFVRGAPTEEAVGPLVVSPKVERALRALVSRGVGQERALRLWVVGPSGAGKSALAAKLSADEGVAHWEVDSRALLTASDAEQAARELVREARLAGASLEFAGAKAWLLPENARLARLLDELLSDHRGRAYFTDEEPAALPAWPSGGPLRLELGPLSVVERAQVWAAHLPYIAAEGLAHDLARRFVLPPGKIAQAARSAWAEACARGGRRVEPTLEELLRACRQAQGEAVGSLAQRLNQPFGWEDLIAPPKTLAALEEIVRFARQRQRLLEGWGFGRRLAYGRALTALFSGPPGTGKTMAAGIVASELNLDVYRIDLSQLTSHYIGETEKNLKRVFEYARASQSALLFDEADAVFAKRTEVKTSNDRYANMEVNYLLQLMEEFDGVVLLTTNARDSIDAAFLRRIRFKVEFPAPDEQERLRLWRAMLPPEVPTQGDLDLAELAAAYELSGAHIKNVVVRAAISALSQDVPLRMAHLTEAAELEYAELGRLRVSG